jgi:hypothetical protein
VGLLGIRLIGVLKQPGIRVADGFTVLLDIRDDQNFRMRRMAAITTEGISAGFTEFLRKGNLLSVAEALIAQTNDRMVVKRAFNFLMFDHPNHFRHQCR